MTTAPIRAVWTDFGGVLTPSRMDQWGDFCAKLGVSPRVLYESVMQVTARYGTNDLMEPLDTPLVSEAEWLSQVGEVLQAQHGITAELTTLGYLWFDESQTNHVWADHLRQLRAGGLFVGVLSNMVPAWDEHWRRLLPVEEMFDDVVLSFEVGTRKPKPEVYTLAAQRAGVPAEQCVLIDDVEANCEAAVAAGWGAVEFQSNEQAIADLAKLLAVPAAVPTGATS